MCNVHPVDRIAISVVPATTKTAMANEGPVCGVSLIQLRWLAKERTTSRKNDARDRGSKCHNRKIDAFVLPAPFSELARPFEATLERSIDRADIPNLDDRSSRERERENYSMK